MISGRVNSIHMNVTDLKTYFKTNVKAKDLNVKVHAFESVFVTSVNVLMLSGRKLDVNSRTIKKQFSETQMFIYDHYLMIEAKPKLRE